MTHGRKHIIFTIPTNVMKNLFVTVFTLFLCIAAQAQANKIKSNVPDGADPAAIDIVFQPVDAVVLPNGDVKIGVGPKGIVRNIGTKPYTNGGSPVNIVLYQLKNGQFQVVTTKQVNVLNPGATVEIQYYTTYIKGKEKKPTFRLEVRSVNSGVPNPDVNMNNNKREEQP
jgi:hypothetical protein